MAKCDCCGNDYQKAFRVTTSDGTTHTFDSFECAIHTLAPSCATCGCTIVGHGIEGENVMYCCAHCARKDGESEAVDNVAD